MVSAGVHIVYETSQAAVATWRHATVLAFRERISVEAIEACVSAANRLALETQCCVLSIVGERVQVPDIEAMRSATAMLQDTSAVCRARVVLGTGLRASAIRGAVGFTTIQEATVWLAHTMNKDATWRQQLTTMAGTLLYGSPSFSRRSQIAPYLAGEDVSRCDTPPDPASKPRR